jgi:tRNA G18 (ribose-2'-O)-methylase SpoU
MIEVASPDDPRLAQFHVKQERQLRATGRFVAEGPLVVDRLLSSRFRCRAVLASANKLSLAERAVGAEVFVADDAVMRRVRGFDFHRGIVAIGEGEPLGEPPAAKGLVLALAGVEDAENLGGLIRVAAAFGCSAVWLDGSCHDPLYRRVIRVSMGHALGLPIHRTTDLPELLRKTKGTAVAAVLADDAVRLAEVATDRPAVVVVGNEAHGVPDDVAAACRVRAMVSMAAGVDSLNVTVAAGIFLHHLRGG